jgi:exopolysaccharide production protein ExoQ
MTSAALWVPLLWIAIVGSRPISFWLGGGIHIVRPEDYLEGSPLDRGVYTLLLVMGLVVLLIRRVDWGKIYASNRWFFAFFIYCGISIIWSDYSFVSFKRWTKEVGNIVMVLIILTEIDPVQAFKDVFARFTNIVIPLSVLFIKYFPNIGRKYNIWSWEYMSTGVTTDKNDLGYVVFICGLFIIWDIIDMRSGDSRKTNNTDLLTRIVLLLMVFWLLDKANSMTSVVSLMLGTSILLVMRIPYAKSQVRYLGMYSLALGGVIFLLYSIPGMLESLVGMLGRNMTLTGRTDLWADLMKEPVNPILGTGYKSFWLGPGAVHMWEKYYFHPNQAHNGYLETYLNGGLVGLSLLIGTIISTGKKLRKELLLGNSYGILCFTFLAVFVFYNWTEAMISGTNLVWIILIVAALTYPCSSGSITENTAEITINVNRNGGTKI